MTHALLVCAAFSLLIGALVHYHLAHPVRTDDDDHT